MLRTDVDLVPSIDVVLHLAHVALQFVVALLLVYEPFLSRHPQHCQGLQLHAHTMISPFDLQVQKALITVVSAMIGFVTQ